MKDFPGIGLREEERAAVVDVIVGGLALLFGMALDGDDFVCYFLVDF